MILRAADENRNQFLEAARRLESGAPWQDAAAQRLAIRTALYDSLDVAGFAPVLAADGGFSISIAGETLLIEFDTFPATSTDLERRRATEANHVV
jgi:hypothetical protein